MNPAENQAIVGQAYGLKVSNCLNKPMLFLPAKFSYSKEIYHNQHKKIPIKAVLLSEVNIKQSSKNTKPTKNNKTNNND